MYEKMGIIKSFTHKKIPFAKINDELEMLRQGTAKGRIVLTIEE